MYASQAGELLAGELGKISVFRGISMNAIHRGLDYCIYTGVPARCLSPMYSTASSQVIDLLICRGPEAIQAIVIDGDSEKWETLFSAQLAELPHLFLSSGELIEDVVRSLRGEIEFRLRCDQGDPLHTGCMLYPVTMSYAASRMDESAVAERVRTGLLPLLREKHLVGPEGCVTPYGHACGLFRRHLGNRAVYVTTRRSIGQLRRAMAWQDMNGEDRSLQNRLSLLARNIPADGGQRAAHMLRQLMRTPLETLFAGYSQDMSRLNFLLGQAQLLSQGSEISAFGDMAEITTYGQCISAIRNFWEYTAHSDCRNQDAADICEKLLAYLSFPLWSAPLDDREREELPRQAGLHVRLNQISPKHAQTSALRIPLMHYFHAIAVLSESEYPLWLYRTHIQPWLAPGGLEKSSFIQAMEAVYQLSQSDDEETQADYFPLMYNILVDPFSGLL